MKFKVLAAIFLGFFSITGFAVTSLPSPKASAEPIDQIAAIVNDDIITQSQINQAYARAKKQIAKRGITAPSPSVIKTDILNQLIYQTLQLQLAKRYGFKITPPQISAAIKSIAKQHKMTLTQLKQKVAEDGMTYAQYRQEIQHQILMTMVQRQALMKDIEVTETDVNEAMSHYLSQPQYTKQYHLVDLRVPHSTPKKTLSMLRAQLLKEKRPAHLKGAQIVDMKWQSSAALPDLFLKPLETAKPGSIIGPLNAQNGYHFLEVIGIKNAKQKAPTRQQIRNQLMQHKLNQALGKWLSKLRDKASVRIVTPQ